MYADTDTCILLLICPTMHSDTGTAMSTYRQTNREKTTDTHIPALGESGEIQHLPCIYHTDTKNEKEKNTPALRASQEIQHLPCMDAHLLATPHRSEGSAQWSLCVHV
jgi:hypothetical protein